MVRFLTRRFIGDYSSDICFAYPHTVSLDNSPVAVIVWDSPAVSSQEPEMVVQEVSRNSCWMVETAGSITSGTRKQKVAAL